MNNRLFKLGALLVVLMLFVAFNTFAQLSTVYVDVTNGSDTYSGANATNSPAGTGPKATIGGGLGAVANNGTIIIMAGSYNGGDNAGAAIDISTANYSKLVAGGSLTIQFQTLLSNNQVLLSAGNFTYEVSGGTLNIATTTGTEYFTLGAGAATLTLGNGTMNSTMGIPTNSFFQLPSGSTIVLNGTSAFSNAAPKVGANVSLTYQGGSSITGGPESNYATYGTGVITVNKTAGTTLSLPNAITAAGGITVTSGNVTFGSSVTMGAYDITNNGTGTVTFSGNLALGITDGTANGNIGSVVNASTGSIIVNGTATWTAGTFTGANVFAAGAGTYIIDNQSTGTINFTQPITLNNSQVLAGATWQATVTANNGAAGTLSLGTISTPTSGAGATYVIPNVQNTAAGGTLNLAGGTILGTLTNTSATGTTNVTGALTVTGVLTNAGTIALAGNTLTLDGAVANLTNTGTISATGSGNVVASKAGSSFNGGTFPAVNITGTTVTVSGSATVASLNVTGALAISNGVTLTSKGVVTETGDITVGSGATGILALKGDFNRTSGTFAAAAGSTVLVNGTVAQNINGGPLFQVVNLTFSNTAAVVTLGASIRATGTVTINSGVNVALNTLNIILNATTAAMTNNGTYSASGGGGVILGGALTVVGGIAGSGITIGGTGLYSYVTVDVGGAFNTATLSSSVKFTGVLTLRSGTLATSTYDLSPNGTSASVVRWVKSATVINTTGGTFDAAAVDYDLTYTETLTGTATVAAGTSEFSTGNVRNLTVSTTAFTLTLTSGVAVTVKGNMVLSTAALFVLDAATPYSLTVKGALTVNGGATTALSGGNSGNTITLSGDGMTHTVLGTISCASILTVTGNGSVLNGSTVTADAATVNNLAFEPTANSASFTSSNLKSISTGPLTVEGSATATGATASITMNPTSASLSGNIAIGAGVGAPAPTVAVTINGATTSAHTGNILVTSGALTYTRGGASTTMTGNITGITAGSLTLGSNLTVTGTTAQAAGNLVLGAFNLTQQGAYTHTGTGTVTGTGTFIIGYTASAAFTLTTAVTIPNVQLNASAKTRVVTLTTANLTVSNSLTLTMGTFDFGALNLNFTGSTITTNVVLAGDVILAATGGGILNLGNGTSGSVTWTSNDDLTMPAGTTFTLNSAGTVTLVSDKETAATPVKRTWNLVNFTYTAAVDFVTGINDVKIAGAFDRSSANAGTWSQGTGYLYFNTTTAFKPGTGFSIDNLNVGAAISSNTPASDVMTVNKNLVLTATPGVLTMAAGKLTLGNGCTVERQIDGAKLSSIPTFAGAVSVVYSTTLGIVTAANFNELPATVTNFSVLTPATVTLPANVTVNGSLTLSGALTTTVSTPNVTMANGATLVLKANGGTVLPTQDLILAGTLNITYDGATATSTRELGAITSSVHTVTAGNVKFNSATVLLDAALTIGGTTTFSGGTVDMNAFALTLNGDVIQTNSAGFFTNSGAAKALTFGGSTNTLLTLKATWSVPGTSIKFTMNKGLASNTVTLSGGDLDFATNSAAGPAAPITLYLTQGLLVTGANNVILKQSDNASNQPVQGFSGASASSYVVGAVKKFVDETKVIDIALVTFPVGTPTPSNYRPLTIYFKTAPTNSINVTVSHMDTKAGGQNGFPISFTSGSQTVKITNYPAFFWYVKSDISLNPSYQYDFEAQAQGYTDYVNDQIQNVRLVRRDSGSVNNPWILQQNWLTSVAQYDNSTIAANWPVVKVISATGGITTQGSIFSYSQNNKAPAWTTAPANLVANEGDTLKINYTSTDPDFNDFPTITAVTKPADAIFAVTSATSTSNPATATINWPVPYTLATKAVPTATATITLRTTDSFGPLSKDTTITITVNNVNRKPNFAATGSAKLAATTTKDGQALAFSYIALDPDGDAVTYVGVGLPTGATVSTAGALAWTPTFAQAGSPYTITVVASDGLLTDTATAVVTVNKSVLLGDVDKNGTVGAADASLILKHAANLTLITDAAALWAADVTGNGQVTAYDAAYVLYYNLNNAWPTAAPTTATHSLAKIGEAAGALSWSNPEATKDADVLKVGLNISNSANVYAVQLSSKVNASLASVEGVNAALPEGWEMQWSFNNGELRVAMAGATPLPSGSVATVMVRLKDKESRLSFSTDAVLNESAQSVGAVEVAAIPASFALDQNYPNPFNPSTTVRYQIPNDANVALDIYNLQGQKIRTLVSKEQKAGYYSVVWDGRNEAGQTVSSGLYLYRVQAGSFVATHKMLMIK